MSKIVELRQDRGLIRSNFDGYKLSLDPVPILRQTIENRPQKAEPNEEQYSLLHSELFSMQNLLQVDPWLRTSAYHVNCAGEVVRNCYDEKTGRPDASGLQVVYRLCSDMSLERRVKGDYNHSMRFISEKYCVLCDGIQQLILLDTGDRLKAREWKIVASTKITTSADGSERNFMLYDCRLDTIHEQKQISLVLGRVHRKEETTIGVSSHFLQLHWAKWTCEETWKFVIIDSLEGKGSLYYCAFEPRGESLVVSSNRDLIFRSQQSVEGTLQQKEESANQLSDERPQLHGDSEPERVGYTWSQTGEDIDIKFNVEAGREKTDYNIKCDTDKLTVKCIEEILLDSALFAKIDQDMTTWTIENNFVQITLLKHNSGVFWPSLLADGDGPLESMENVQNQNCLPVEQQPIANLEAPIEDCDFPMGVIEDEIKIVRFNLSTKSATHTVLLGSMPPLFATSLRPGFPLALVTRQDVDACVWLQQYNPTKPELWSLRHEGNLHAFGYVQASKQQKKFMDCSPDLNFSVIAESHRHIFLYKSNYDTANGLRNRSGPQVTLGKQHLITLEDAGEVLGMTTASGVVTLLTENAILYLQIN